MKKLFLIAAILIPAITFSQIFSSLAAGYDTKGTPIGTLAFGYNKGLLNFQGEIRPSLTRKVEMNNLLGFRLSANLVNPDEDGLMILPGIGYYYNRKSSDKRNLNKWQYGYTLKAGTEISEGGNAVFIEGMYIDRSAQITIGMQVNFR